MRRPTNHHTPPRSDYTPTPTFSPPSPALGLTASATLVIHPSAVDVFCPLQLIHRRSAPPTSSSARPFGATQSHHDFALCSTPFTKEHPANILLRPAASRCIRLRRDPPSSRLMAPSPPSRAPATFAALALIAALRTAPLLVPCSSAPPNRHTVAAVATAGWRFRRRRGHHGCHLAFLPLTTTPPPTRCRLDVPHHDA
ncbi:hypothetical protein B0H14DRAFT_3454975 [Mycena olivaceomarginata]|nr:hypothetical protein B0H14DRAFT_3454975 [Mycena olivaceomarginata]